MDSHTISLSCWMDSCCQQTVHIPVLFLSIDLNKEKNSTTLMNDNKIMKSYVKRNDYRFGDEERRLMHLVPAPAVRLKKRWVLSRPGVNSLLALGFFLSEFYNYLFVHQLFSFFSFSNNSYFSFHWILLREIWNCASISNFHSAEARFEFNKDQHLTDFHLEITRWFHRLMPKSLVSMASISSTRI